MDVFGIVMQFVISLCALCRLVLWLCVCECDVCFVDDYDGGVAVGCVDVACPYVCVWGCLHCF